MSDMKNKNAKSPGENQSAQSFDNKALLDNLGPDDIVSSHTYQKRKNATGALRLFFMFVFACVFVIASFNVISSTLSRIKADKYYDSLRDIFYGEQTIAGNISYLAPEVMSADDRLYSEDGSVFESQNISPDDLKVKYELMLPNLEALKSINGGAFAWIKVGGTRVDYPIVKGSDNDYYLDHALDRTYSVSGSVFVDYMNSTNLDKNRNTCVYGHNMNDGTMFQTIMNFKNVNQFKNGRIEIYTKDGIYIYTPFSAYEADPYYYFYYTEFPTDEYYAQFLSDIKERSMHASSITPTVQDKIVTLITCTNTVEDNRFVVHGVLTEVVK